jgi:hypothetical protein
MGKKDLSFQLRFDPSEIDGLAKRYLDPDGEAFRAGKLIVAGDRGLATLKIIFRWKTGGRGQSRLSKNTEDEIKRALNLVVDAPNEQVAMQALCELHGVDVPVASAILTAISPDRYTVIDFRALESLGIKRSYLSVGFYLTYLAACRDLAQQHAVTLRTLDRALWQWSSERSAESEGKPLKDQER